MISQVHNIRPDPFELQRIASSLGMGLFGIADLGRVRMRWPDLVEQVPPALSMAVIMGHPLLAAVVETVKGAPNPLYFHHYRQVNFQLDRAALRVATALQEAGRRALPVPASQTLDPEDLTALLSHRHLAVEAGLGWRGRNNLLVTPEHGARLRLVSVLTDAPLEPSPPRDLRGCGSCRACIRACPARAIGESGEFDLAACHAKLKEFRRIPRVGQLVCGVCVKACRPRPGPGKEDDR